MESIMPYLADGILLLIFVSVVLQAARRGFARAMAGIAAWIIAAILALQFCAPLAQTAYTRFLQTRVTDMAQEQIDEHADTVKTAELAAELLQQIPQAAVQVAQSVGVKVDSLPTDVQDFSPNDRDLAQQIEERVLRPVILAAMKGVCFLLILVAVSVVLEMLLRPVGNVLHKLPAIGTADRALGGVLGILKAAVAVTVLSIIAKVLAEVIGGGFERAVSMSKIIPFIENSPFAGKFFQG